MRTAAHGMWWMRRALFGLFLALLFGVAMAPAVAADPPAFVGPSLIISYHVAPANRVAFRSHWEHTEQPQFRKWKEEGVLRGFKVLFNRHVDSDNWDALAVLDFRDVNELIRWQQIERAQPAGLSAAALALTREIHTVPAGLVRSGAAVTGATEPTWLVIPYAILVSAPEYLKYLDSYVLPQFDGWVQEGALSSYGVYMGTFPAGRPWSTLVILEYRSEQDLALRDAVVARVRARLAMNPQWKAISDNKTRIRDERQLIVADAPGAP